MDSDAARQVAAELASLRSAEERLIGAIEGTDEEVATAATEHAQAVGDYHCAFDRAHPPKSPINLGDRASGVVKEQPIGGQS